MWRGAICLAMLVALWLAPAQAQEPIAPSDQAPAAAGAASTVMIIPIHGEINDLTYRFLLRGVEQAKAEGIDTIVFDVNTPGGLVSSAIDISQLIKGLAELHTVAWVNPEAISAGALISLATNEIVIAPRAKIGDCAAIMVGPQGLQTLGETERAKIDSYILAEFRDSANANHYPQAMCEAMVTLGPAIYRIKNIQTDETVILYEDQLGQYAITEASLRQFGIPVPPAPEGDATPSPPAEWQVDKLVLKARALLTMLTDEAMEYGFATALVSDETELLAHLELSDAQILRLEQNWSERMVGFLTSPFVRGILTIILLMGLYSEMQSPGLGVAGGVALGAALILLGAPYLTGLATIWEILVIIAGIMLIVVEVFVLPGFGVAGIAGLFLMFVGLLLTFVPPENGPGFWPTLPGTWDALGEGALTMVLAMTIASIGMVVIAKYMGTIPLFRKIILENQTHEIAGGASAGVGTGLEVGDLKIGDTGLTLSDLHPIGRAEFGSNVYDVVADGGWVASGSRVRITELAGNRIVVEEI